MIQPDGENQSAEGGRDDIGRVIAAAEPDLQDDIVAGLFIEVEEGEEGEKLKGPRLLPAFLQCGEELLRELRKTGIADLLSIYGPALIDRQEVRGELEAAAVSALCQDALQHRGAGALSVRPRDMQGSEPLLGMPEQGEDMPHYPEIGPLRGVPVSLQKPRDFLPVHVVSWRFRKWRCFTPPRLMMMKKWKGTSIATCQILVRRTPR